MAQVHLVRRWGSHQAGQLVDVDDAQAQWLLNTSFAVRPGQEANSRHGGEGVDPNAMPAGADPTRRRMTAAPKGPRDGERARRVQGAPRPVGDVTHVAPENLGPEHKGDGGDVLLASGKRLSEDLAEQQAELDAAEKQAEKASEGEQGRKLTQPKK